MESDELPIWYPLREIEGTDFQVNNFNEIENLVKIRLDTLSDKKKQELKRDVLESKAEFKDRIMVDRKGFSFLKMGVALDPKLSAWLIEVEGDLFQNRFLKAPWSDKRKILNDLFPIKDELPTWMELDSLNSFLQENVKSKLKIPDEEVLSTIRIKKLGTDVINASHGLIKHIGIDFRYASYLVKTRKAILYRGWVIGTIEKLSSTIKKRFEKLLYQQLSEYGERIETEASGPIKRLSNRLNEKLRSLVRVRKEYKFSNFKLSGTYDDHMKLYPPCIQDLLNTVNKVGYIPHWERFQLGLFLKHTGMPVDDQLEFWFNKAVDNINITFGEFKKRAGYIIRHIYGLEGAKIDYDMPGCTSIQNKMYCTFRHQGIENINQRIKDHMQTLDGQQQAIKLEIAQKISDHSVNGFPNHACGKNLEMVTDIIGMKIIHPMQYLQLAAKSKNLLIEEENEIEDEVNNE